LESDALNRATLMSGQPAAMAAIPKKVNGRRDPIKSAVAIVHENYKPASPSHSRNSLCRALS
jgi:hypothetical protein